MTNRRLFLQSILAATLTPAVGSASRRENHSVGELIPDPEQLLDLPEGFHYTVVSRAGESMADGLRVPAWHDGMAAFPGPNGRINLLCNHEIAAGKNTLSAFAAQKPLSDALRNRLYDRGDGDTPLPGGTTTTVYNPASRTVERQHLSLGGTESNCAGGPTPWGSWLSCEECFTAPGKTTLGDSHISREQRHGYVFEVPSQAQQLTAAEPIRAMGRFEHEAAAVDPLTGIVYMTEDRQYGLFYRYVPEVPGQLQQGGKLQALCLSDQPAAQTHNWGASADIALHKPLAVHWTDLHDVDPDENDLRLRGAQAGAATFARGEGLCHAGGDLVFTCTAGGPERFGQIFAYRPAHNSTDKPDSSSGTLTLLAELSKLSLLHHCDNLTAAPWGDLIVCEDTSGHCGLVGVRPDGRQYTLAYNSHSSSELAGACFAPDGKTLFINIQYPGMTLAIHGPWPAI